MTRIICNLQKYINVTGTCIKKEIHHWLHIIRQLPIKLRLFRFNMYPLLNCTGRDTKEDCRNFRNFYGGGKVRLAIADSYLKLSLHGNLDMPLTNKMD